MVVKDRRMHQLNEAISGIKVSRRFGDSIIITATTVFIFYMRYLSQTSQII